MNSVGTVTSCAVATGSNDAGIRTPASATGGAVAPYIAGSQSSVAWLGAFLRIACAERRANSGQSRRIAFGIRGYGAVLALGTPIAITRPMSRPLPAATADSATIAPNAKPQ